MIISKTISSARLPHNQDYLATKTTSLPKTTSQPRLPRKQDYLTSSSPERSNTSPIPLSPKRSNTPPISPSPVQIPYTIMQFTTVLIAALSASSVAAYFKRGQSCGDSVACQTNCVGRRYYIVNNNRKNFYFGCSLDPTPERVQTSDSSLLDSPVLGLTSLDSSLGALGGIEDPLALGATDDALALGDLGDLGI
ncbi:uncharacterized protein RCC_03684 [Ramularia collo-cygni]|uniref:Uncharacterized protein n=1 Tax=Ramularia collo-cygni TaxID=112498 RepID=A0A2D3USN4_9PEZI|nr:uncharacterized protein RCC_03684 [Ramularia collo-cygni]CZT17848.1 uncharacterized protein RCC_03684 [Ramularia collo-cygni]